MDIKKKRNIKIRKEKKLKKTQSTITKNKEDNKITKEKNCLN